MPITIKTPELARYARQEGFGSEDEVLFVNDLYRTEGIDPVTKKAYEDSLSSESVDEFIQVAENSAGTHYEKLPWHKPGAEVMEAIQHMIAETPEACHLTPRETSLFSAWIQSGVRFNTKWMMTFLMDAVERGESKWAEEQGINSPPFPGLESRRCLATTLFTDTFNRADEVFDELRERFVKEDHVEMSPLLIPIMAVDGEEPATVDDMVSLFTKIVAESEEYSLEEQRFIKEQFLWFYQTTTEAMKTYESRPNYTFDDAVQLRGQTLRPLSTMMTHVYHTSRLIDNDNDRLFEHGHDLAEAVSKISMITQIHDDWVDLDEDVKNGNISLFYGAMQEVGETYLYTPGVRWDDHDSDEYDDEGSQAENFMQYPKTMTLLMDYKDHLIDSLPPEYRHYAQLFRLF